MVELLRGVSAMKKRGISRAIRSHLLCEENVKCSCRVKYNTSLCLLVCTAVVHVRVSLRIPVKMCALTVNSKGVVVVLMFESHRIKSLQCLTVCIAVITHVDQ